MNKKLKAFIYALIISMVCFVIAIITFGEGGAYGLIPLAIGLFFLFRYTLPALKRYRAEMGEIPFATKQEAIQIKCENLIEQYGKTNSVGTTSCKDKIMPLLNSQLKNSQDIPEDNLDKFCHFLLSEISLSLLASGEFHIYSGQLNTMGYAPSIRSVYEKSTKWLFDNKFLTEEEYNNSITNLRETIKNSG